LFGGQGGMWWNSRFDKAITGLLGCLKELIMIVEKEDSSFVFPYDIKDDLIGGITIRYTTNEALWTKSMKYFLTNLKWILVWTSKHL
jgi:beclin